MPQNQDNNYAANRGMSRNEDDSEFEVSNQGQNLGGGKDDSAGNRNPANNQDQLGGSEDTFRKTDQTITQAAPGQTMINQGESDA